MAAKRKPGHIEKFLRRADKAIDDGIKKADEILDDAVEFGVMAAGQANKTGKELRKRAEEESKILKERGSKKILEGVVAAKHVATNAEEDLRTLEKLGKLKKAGVITEKEFQEKKKKILARI